MVHDFNLPYVVSMFVDAWAELGMGKEGRLRHGGDATSGRVLDINWQEAFGNSLVSLTLCALGPQ